MADRRMKSVSGGGERGEETAGGQLERGCECEDEEWEDLQLILSLGRAEWGALPVDPPEVGLQLQGGALWGNHAPVSDGGIGSSRAAEGASVFDSMRWEELPDPGGRLVAELELFDRENVELIGHGNGDNLDRDLQNKRPKVGFCPETEKHALVSFGGVEACWQSRDCEPLNLSLLREDELPSCLSLSRDDSLGVPANCFNSEDSGACASGARSDDSSEIRMDFSDDLLYLIFSFLDQKDLCRAGATCKQWHAAGMHEDFWRCLKFEDTGVSQQNFTAICRRYPKITELNISGVPNADTLLMEGIPFLSCLQTLTMGHGQLADALFGILSECPQLIILRIFDASLGCGMQEITVFHETMRELQIVRCRALRISVRCPQLQTLSLKRSTMSNVSLHCPQLNVLDFSSCHKLSDTAIRQAVTACPLLVSLDMSACSSVGDETLRDLAVSCPNLSTLDVSNCPNVAFESVRLPMLVDLKLLSCEGITCASITAISSSCMLEVLQLDNCNLLTAVSLDLPHLRSISLVHLRKFVELNLRSPVLSYIKISRCSSLSRIRIISSALQKLVLQKQESLASLSLQCLNLVEVDLSDCSSLTNSVCEVFSDGGSCPKLRFLVLDNCESLNMVELRSSSLINLSLAGCRAMTALKLSCPNLQKVSLDGCDHLEKALFHPVGLEAINLGICPKLTFLHIEAPDLTLLELKGCGVLCQASIHCPRLSILDASFCRQLLDASLSSTATSCSLIECLILSSCLSIGTEGLYSLQWLQKLTLLDLSYTFLIDLNPVFQSCSQLKTLKLSACKFLADTSLDALYRKGALPNLIELDLSYSSVSQSVIMELLSACINLVHVNLNGCINLHELVWGSTDHDPTSVSVEAFESPSVPLKHVEAQGQPERLLEVLNCTGCPNIRKAVITSMAHCVNLSKINLNLSANLKEVDLTCSTLSSINLSNCCSLEALKLDCPKLANLQLMACSMLPEEELESAISGCSMLEVLNIHSCPKINALDMGRLRTVCPSLKRVHSSLLV